VHSSTLANCGRVSWPATVGKEGFIAVFLGYTKNSASKHPLHCTKPNPFTESRSFYWRPLLVLPGQSAGFEKNSFNYSFLKGFPY
jgi:hypothetical protein